RYARARSRAAAEPVRVLSHDQHALSFQPDAAVSADLATDLRRASVGRPGCHPRVRAAARLDALRARLRRRGRVHVRDARGIPSAIGSRRLPPARQNADARRIPSELSSTPGPAAVLQARSVLCRAGVIPSLDRTATWTPTLGAVPTKGGAQFTVWAPDADRVDVVFVHPDYSVTRALSRLPNGCFTAWEPDVGHGARY